MTTSPQTFRSPLAEHSFDLGGDLPVRRLGFGAMRLSDGPGRPSLPAPVWRPPADRQGALAVLRRAVDLGVDIIDTSDAYALGGNEELIAEALHPYPERLVIATKCGVARPSRDEWAVLGRPEYLRQQAELSLRRLRVERLDLLQLHRVDPLVPLADQIGALRRLQEEGKIWHIGLSEVTVEQIREASSIAHIASVQNRYNVTAREHDAVVDYCERRGIAFLPFYPVATGDHARAGGTLAAIADEIGATPVQVSLAWLLRRAPNVIPIPGTTSLRHLEENMASLDIPLSEKHMSALSALA